MDEDRGINIVVVLAGAAIILMGVAILVLTSRDGLSFSDIAVSSGCSVIGGFMTVTAARDLWKARKQ